MTHRTLGRLGLLCGLLAGIWSASTASAQDPVFSQHTAAPVYTNPALAGLFEGDLRVVANYREQWGAPLGGQPLRTMAASGEMRFEMGGRDYFAVAANVLQDEGGQSAFTVTRAGLGMAVQKYLDGGRGRDATYLGFGARAGYGQHRLSDDGLWFSSDFDSTSLSVTRDGGNLPPGFTGATRGYLDVSGGVNLSVVRRDYSVFAGVAAHHLNRPNVSFLYDQRTTLATRFSAMLGGEWLLRDELRVLPSATYQVQGPAHRLTAGASLYYKPDARGDAGFRAGLYGRTARRLDGGSYLESLVVAGGVEFRRMTVGASYDLNTGAVGRATDGRGAYELSVSWRREGRSRYEVVCPKF